MRISDWSSDVCSSDLEAAGRVARSAKAAGVERLAHLSGIGSDPGSSSPYIASRGRGEQAVRDAFPAASLIRTAVIDRKTVVWGQSVSVRVDIGGRGCLKKKTH